MDGKINKDFLDLIECIKKDPEKYENIKSCKNLDEMYYLIKKIHPEYTFSKDELENFILNLASLIENNILKIPDKKLDTIGGGNKELDDLINRWRYTGHRLNSFGSSLDLTTEMMFSGDNLNLEKISKLLIDISEGKSHSRLRNYNRISSTVRRKHGRSI